jgi:hypothetical protein
MIELSVIRDLVAIFGVIGGFTYYVWNVRNAEKSRKTEHLLLRIGSFDPTYSLAVQDVMSQDWGSTTADWNKQSPESRANYDYVVLRYNNVGLLLKQKLMDPDVLYQLFSPRFVMRLWEKIELVIKDNRDKRNYPTYLEAFEYLYHDAKKRYPDIIL